MKIYRRWRRKLRSRLGLEEVNASRPKGRFDFNKIFCIGANKTGTTTLEVILTTLGYRLGDQSAAEVQVTREVLEGDTVSFVDLCNKSDAFQDLPFSMFDVYITADVLFPKSKFILSERDPEDWFLSLKNFHQKVFELEDMGRLTEQDVIDKFGRTVPGLFHYLASKQLINFGGKKPFVDWDKLYDRDVYVADYVARNNRIKQYFSNRPEDLLVIDVTVEQDTRLINDFLGLPEKMIFPMPHADKT